MWRPKECRQLLQRGAAGPEATSKAQVRSALSQCPLLLLRRWASQLLGGSDRVLGSFGCSSLVKLQAMASVASCKKALMAAARAGSAEAVSLLLAARADPRLVSRKGRRRVQGYETLPHPKILRLSCPGVPLAASAEPRRCILRRSSAMGRHSTEKKSASGDIAAVSAREVWNTLR